MMTSVPFPAIIITYETNDSITMVHSYSRAYSNLEVEDGKIISQGHEACWILKDNENIESFAVIQKT